MVWKRIFGLETLPSGACMTLVLHQKGEVLPGPPCHPQALNIRSSVIAREAVPRERANLCTAHQNDD